MNHFLHLSILKILPHPHPQVHRNRQLGISSQAMMTGGEWVGQFLSDLLLMVASPVPSPWVSQVGFFKSCVPWRSPCRSPFGGSLLLLLFPLLPGKTRLGSPCSVRSPSCLSLCVCPGAFGTMCTITYLRVSSLYPTPPLHLYHPILRQPALDWQATGFDSMVKRKTLLRSTLGMWRPRQVLGCIPPHLAEATPSVRGSGCP